jgi:pilus assembly protein Flp/PilA
MFKELEELGVWIYARAGVPARHLEERLRAERGQALVEYALILVLIAVVVIAMLILLGARVNNVFNFIANAMNQPS